MVLPLAAAASSAGFTGSSSDSTSIRTGDVSSGGINFGASLFNEKLSATNDLVKIGGSLGVGLVIGFLLSKL